MLPSTRALPKVTQFQIGYLMGLIVGEGSFTGDRKAPALQVKLHENDPLPLLNLKLVLGGEIHGPYHHTGKDGTVRHYTVYFLRGKPLVALLPLIHRYLPQSRKREQFELWLAKYGLTRVVAGQLKLLYVEHSKKSQQRSRSTEQLRLIQ